MGGPPGPYQDEVRNASGFEKCLMCCMLCKYNYLGISCFVVVFIVCAVAILLGAQLLFSFLLLLAVLCSCGDLSSKHPPLFTFLLLTSTLLSLLPHEGCGCMFMLIILLLLVVVPLWIGIENLPVECDKVGNFFLLLSIGAPAMTSFCLVLYFLIIVEWFVSVRSPTSLTDLFVLHSSFSPSTFPFPSFSLSPPLFVFLLLSPRLPICFQRQRCTPASCYYDDHVGFLLASGLHLLWCRGGC